MLLADLPMFGGGSGEPYAHALADTARKLYLHEVHGDGDGSLSPGRPLDVGRFLRAADAIDGDVIRGVRGPVLDVGCGPGRMVRAAGAHGHVAMGIDVSAAAVGLARQQGLSVLRRSVFDHVPGAGRWGTAVLFDGNIGIGGDPIALLRRCAALVLPTGGGILVETHADPFRDRVFRSVLVDDLGRRSLPFRWAEVGAVALRCHAAAAGLAVGREWTAAARTFAEYRRR